jgi:hypothetical protein
VPHRPTPSPVSSTGLMFTRRRCQPASD